MLKSTYKPSPAVAAATAPLQPGWTEHKAPSGHTYYYNAATKQSTYKRPVVESVAAPIEPAVPVYPSLATPAAANAFMAQVNPQHFQQTKREAPKNDRPKPKPQPIDKPRSQEVIPGHEGWYLVYTKYNRRFVYNAVKDASYWRIPEKLSAAILEMDRMRIRVKAGVAEPVKVEVERQAQGPELHQEDDSEYEEVEVTDDEDAHDNDGDEHGAKRQRTDDEQDNGPVEFTEEDIMMQLQAMGDDYHDYDEQDQEPLLSEEDARALFWDMLNDFKISPFSPWEKLLEDGKVVDDPRYTVLATTKARKECWDAWSREKIRIQKERRATEEKADPRAAYIAFLAERATPKLFWPEFKRKFRKEACMTSRGLADKEREKIYRDLVGRMKLAPATLKSDLMALLKAQPLSVLNRDTDAQNLPAQVRCDLAYVSVAPEVREPLVQAYMQTLAGAPEGGAGPAGAEEQEAARKAGEARKRREQALAESERRADEEKRKQRRALEQSKVRLKEGEEQVAAAMAVGKRGLQSQLER
ncbi:hypothetical protein TD95_003972 [Thielaviopsis punctulata]|uniref:WW domain-containing protein n=1 Tax=Thielaviopsis punctulata TaxID=72032 RepID=A0A0F4ZC61_9PEZI|nr:hypothetical protein TD95_002354 [Thielaviopsis punctulata]KKA30400.1 hypothetical protein TD95_003972 [Thielaviopsis punctulata]